LLVLGFQLLFIYLVNDLLFVEALGWEAIIFNNLTWGYIITKMFATVVGLVVNYILRKIFIFK
jgi:putative flippase GtrA